MARRLALAAVAVALAGCSTTATDPAPPATLDAGPATTPATLTSRLRPDHEIIVDEVVFPANLELPHHAHPGDEIIRIVSGEVVLGVGSSGNYRLCAGSVWQIPAKTGHHARVGPDGAEAIIVRIHPTGQPVKTDYSNEWPAPVPDIIRTSAECED